MSLITSWDFPKARWTRRSRCSCRCKTTVSSRPRCRRSFRCRSTCTSMAIHNNALLGHAWIVNCFATGCRSPLNDLHRVLLRFYQATVSIDLSCWEHHVLRRLVSFHWTFDELLHVWVGYGARLWPSLDISVLEVDGGRWVNLGSKLACVHLWGLILEYFNLIFFFFLLHLNFIFFNQSIYVRPI